MTDPESIHDRLLRLEQGIAAPVHRWWHHAFAVAGIGAVVVILVLLAWLVSSVVNRYNRGKELMQAAQPVVVAQAVQHQLSEAELVAKYHLSSSPGAVRQAPKPGTKKRQPAARRPDGAAGQAGLPAPAGTPGAASPLVQANDQPERPVTTILTPEQKLPPLRYGGTAIGTLVGKPSEEPAFELRIKPDTRRFHLGGLSRAGAEWDFVGKRAGVFLEHDFLSLGLGSDAACKAKSWRCGRALVLGARPFASYSYQALPGAKTVDYGLPITAAIDF